MKKKNRYVLKITGYDRHEVYGFESKKSIVDLRADIKNTIDAGRNAAKPARSTFEWYGKQIDLNEDIHEKYTLMTWQEYWIEIKTYKL